jgi:hypothetical protein
MVESVKVKAEGSVFSIKKDTILSDLIPRLKLPHEPLFAKIDEQIVERKRGQAPFSFDIPLKKSRKMGTVPIFFRIRRFS